MRVIIACECVSVDTHSLLLRQFFIWKKAEYHTYLYRFFNVDNVRNIYSGIFS